MILFQTGMFTPCSNSHIVNKKPATIVLTHLHFKCILCDIITNHMLEFKPGLRLLTVRCSYFGDLGHFEFFGRVVCGPGGKTNK